MKIKKNLNENKNLKLWEKSLNKIPGGVHSPVRSFKSVEGTPIFFEKAKGAYLFDVNKKKYLDFCMSFGPLILGHLNSKVKKIVKKTAELAWSFGTCEPYSLSLAELITNKIPFVEKIRFVSSGTEAVMSALRLARAYTNRQSILKFEGCYHGHVDSMLVKAGSGLASFGEGDSAGVGNQNTFVLSLDLTDSELEEFFNKRGNELAAIIFEPLPANYGLLIQRNDFWKKVCELAKKFGVVVIFDEVISGFRVGVSGMAGIMNIKPDLVCYGKIIGGGFPVGAFGGKAKILDMLAPNGQVYQAGTLSANPFGMRAGLATLEICFQTKNFYSNLESNTKYFCENLESLLNKYTKKNWEVIHFASLFWIKSKTENLVRKIQDIPKDHKENYNKLFHLFLNIGIYLAPSAYEVGFISLAHTKKILDETLNKIEKTLKKISSDN